jgi:hypothetical protein
VPLQLPGNAGQATPIPQAPTPTRPLPSTATLPPILPTNTPSVPLSASGPWLTYLSASKGGFEVIAANADGSARTVVGAMADVFVPLFGRPSTCSPCWFSIQNGRDETLTLFELPAGKAQKGFALLSNKDLTADQRRLYATILNQAEPASQVWSPDGRYLAFIGAMDGAFTDLYVFDTQSSSINRLTEKTGQTYYPAWSPDGKWILIQEIDTSNQTGSFTVQSVYAISPDGSSFRTLYHPSSLKEQIFGWMQPDTFIVASRRASGLTEARRFNIEQREHARLQYSGLMELSAYSPDSSTLAFTVVSKDKDVPSLPSGLYWTSPSTGPVSVAKGKYQRLEWSAGAGRFFAASAAAVLSYKPGDKVIQFSNEENLPKASPDGKWLAFFSTESGRTPGLRIYTPDGKQNREVTQQGVQEVLWKPDSSGLYFVADGTLNYLPISSGELQPLGSGVSNLGWVGAK